MKFSIKITDLTSDQAETLVQWVHQHMLTSSSESSTEKAQDEQPTKRRLRRTGQPTSANTDTTVAKSPEMNTEISGTDSNKPKRRTRRTSPEEATATATREEPKRRTRRGKTSAPLTEPTATGSVRGRRRKASATPPSDRNITDEDLVKSASTLAQATNPACVEAVLDDFNVEHVQDIPNDASRVAFLDACSAKIEKEG